MITEFIEKRIAVLVESLLTLVDKTGAALMLGAGTAVMLGSIALGIVVPHHVGGVVLAALGSACGALLMTVSSPKLLRPHPAPASEAARLESLEKQNQKLLDQLNEQRDTVHRMRREQGDSEARVKALEAQVKQEKAASAELEEQSVVLAREVRRLERQRINVDSVMPVLRLQLLSVKAKLKDWRHQAYNPSGKEMKKIKGINDYEFLGVMETECTVNLGVDLAELRLVESKGAILVTGIRPGFQGFQKLKTEWTHREIREQERTALSPGQGELIVHAADPRLVNLMQTFQTQTMDRLNEGVDFQHLDQHILKMAETFLRALLDRLGKPIHFSHTAPDVSGLTLNEFIQRHNAALDQRMSELPGGGTQRSLPGPGGKKG